MSAYLLIWHGSRDRRPHLAISHLVSLVARELYAQTHVSPLIDSAPLELGEIPLSQKIVQFAREARSQGYQTCYLCPLFLFNGVHVMEDIPAAVKAAQSQLESRDMARLVSTNILPPLGSRAEMLQLLSSAFAEIPASRRILLSHGSKRSPANQPIAALAAQLDALPAYWSIVPDLETQISVLVTDGQHDIAIQPYFLFAGGITDAIAQQVHHLQLRFINTSLQLGQPLGATPELAQLICNWFQSVNEASNARNSNIYR